MKNNLFEYEYFKPEEKTDKILITKWFDCTGNVEIPQTMGNNTVYGICPGAFRLTDETNSIIIPKSIEWIDREAFDISGVSLGHCIVIKTNYCFNNLIQDNLPKQQWEKLYCSWSYMEFISKNQLEYKDDNCNFSFRLISSSEVEIVRWFSPTDNVNIPSVIGDDLKVVSIGKNAFAEMSSLTKIIVPDTVSIIRPAAFYYMNHRTYTYGDLYDIGWSESSETCDVCEIILPGNIKELSVEAFVRGTESSCRRHMMDGYENRLIISTVDDSQTLNWLLESGWRIQEKYSDKVRLLMDEEKACGCIKQYLMVEPMYKKWITNSIW